MAGAPRSPGFAALFALLWLREIVTDLLARAPSSSASAWRIPTNPVHVLDLAFFLPAAATSGVLLLRHHRLGYATAVGQLTWLALTCIPILVTPLVAGIRGHVPGWTVIGPIGAILLACVAALIWLLRQASPRPALTSPGTPHQSYDQSPARYVTSVSNAASRRPEG